MDTQPPASRAPQRVHLHAHERLRRLCMEIQRGRYPTKADLARLVERSPRTIQNDLRSLQNDFAAPLAFDSERRGFYFTDPAWRLPAIILSEGELIGFFTAERMLRRLGEAADVQPARQALQRLATLLPQEVVVDLEALAEAISFAPEPALDVSPEVLRQLTLAARSRRTLHIHYYSQYRAEFNERDVDVLVLHNALGEWYAICYDHRRAAVRDFHAGRIRQIQQTERTFTPPPDWDAQAYLRRGFGMFRGGQDVLVEVEFDTEQARYASERTFHPTQQRQLLPDGRLRLTFEATEAALEQVARWLMQYGPHARALRPAALRDLLRERLQRAAALYDHESEEEQHA
ncbi:MAG: helix-turn-helix transcriptional regulator [Candidatus Tectimicrobiota bacterium]